MDNISEIRSINGLRIYYLKAEGKLLPNKLFERE